MTLSDTTNASLRSVGLDPPSVEVVIRAAVAEDLAGGVDVTSAATVPADQRSVLDLVVRGSGVLAGGPVAAAVFDAVSAGDSHGTLVTADGARVLPGAVVLTVAGRTRDLLTAERTALNLLCHLSGIATATAVWADALAGSGTRVRDTRKTTPGLRSLEKYAVRCGGGVNHRMALSDAALVKDNHVVAAGGVRQAFAAVHAMWPDLPVEVEVDSLDQLDEVLAAGADLVLLDNFTPDQMREAVRRNAAAAAPLTDVTGRNAAFSPKTGPEPTVSPVTSTTGAGGRVPAPARARALLEASGGLTLADAAAVAATGVDYVAVGALTHSAAVLDIGADLRSSSS